MLKKTLYVFATLFIFLVVVEIFTTILFYFKDLQTTLITVKNVEDAPYLYYKFSESENPATGKKYLNPDGLASDLPVTKTNNKFRIALIGGSVAEGLGRISDSITKQPMFEMELKKMLGYPDLAELS